MAVTCPGCGAPAPERMPHLPPRIPTQPDQREKPSTWWCQPCITTAVHAHRTGDVCYCDEFPDKPHTHP